MELPPRRVELPPGKGLELGLLGGLERVVWLASSVDGRGYSPEGGRRRAAEGLCYRERIRVGTLWSGDKEVFAPQTAGTLLLQTPTIFNRNLRVAAHLAGLLGPEAGSSKG